MNYDYETIVAACKVEADRQLVGPEEHQALVHAYITAMTFMPHHRSHIDMDELLLLARIIEPTDNAEGFRKTPVIFKDISMGLTPDLIEDTLWVLINNQQNMTTDQIIKELLDIHPFRDGNGRLAFIYYNLMEDICNPQPLPDYYDEHKSAHDAGARLLRAIFGKQEPEEDTYSLTDLGEDVLKDVT